MSYQFNYQGKHHCPAAVLSCIDFRFWQTIVEYVHNELGIADFDFPSVPGSAKAINDGEPDGLAMSCVTIPLQLHEAKKIIIVNHADCGAYGGADKHESLDAEVEFHKQELLKAKAKILAKHPDAEVILLFAELIDNGRQIDILTIE